MFIDYDNVVVEGGGRIASRTFESGIGAEIIIEGSSLIVRDGGNILATALGTGTGGDVVLDVSDVTLTSAGNINVSAEAREGRPAADTTGDAGTVHTRNANNLSINNGGHILLETDTDGRGGFLVAEAANIEISNAGFVYKTAATW